MGIQTLQVSWLVDHMLPKKLMYEGELFYLFTDPGCILQVRLWNLISMKPYVTTNLINSFHVTWRCMLLLLDHNFERTIDINIDTMVTEMAKLNHKIVEQASHKMATSLWLGVSNSLFCSHVGVCSRRFVEWHLQQHHSISERYLSSLFKII